MSTILQAVNGGMKGFVLSVLLVACGAPLAGPTPEDGSQRTPPPAAAQTAAAGDRSDPPSEGPSSQPPPAESAGDALGSFGVEIRDEDSPVAGHVLIEVVGLLPNESVELTFSLPGQEDSLDMLSADETGTISYAHPREMGGLTIVARRANGDVATGTFSSDLAPVAEEATAPGSARESSGAAAQPGVRSSPGPATPAPTRGADDLVVLSVTPPAGTLPVADKWDGWWDGFTGSELTAAGQRIDVEVEYTLASAEEGELWLTMGGAIGPDGCESPASQVFTPIARGTGRLTMSVTVERLCGPSSPGQYQLTVWLGGAHEGPSGPGSEIEKELGYYRVR
ncbi:MAG: hypothetical protein ACRDGT_09700 [Candidatus Limnocylindria bacterium]